LPDFRTRHLFDFALNVQEGSLAIRQDLNRPVKYLVGRKSRQLEKRIAHMFYSEMLHIVGRHIDSWIKFRSVSSILHATPAMQSIRRVPLCAF
jgi:ABC-type uncharacterized transport system permease subunit